MSNEWGYGGRARDDAALPSGVSRDAVARACREAGLAFLAGVAGDWGKTELALWLAGPYRDATRFGGSSRGSVPPPPCTVQARGHAIGEQLDRVVREARWQILAALEGLALPAGKHRFIDRAIGAGHVVPRTDAEGRVLWVPVDVAGMRLGARVDSLFAADYLTRPSEYLTDLFVCHRCESVLFDPEARRRGDCGGHATGRFPVAPDVAEVEAPPTRRKTLAWRS